MKVLNPKTRSNSGFSLLEIIIAIAIIAILVGVVGYRSGGAIQRGQASRILQVVKTVEKASATHYADTGNYPVEWMIDAATSNRQLTSTQTYPGWQGPYIDRPFADEDTNPWGNTILYNNLQQGAWITGFDLDGDGTADYTGNGNMLFLTGLPQEVAESIDQALDGGVPGDWFSTGRVVWQSGSDRTLIYVYK